MSGKIPRILLVEDDLGLAAAYKTRMEAEGFDVRHCPNGEDALASALDYHPDLILLDIMMPKISGFDVLDILRNTKETAHTKIIILTALSQPSDRKHAKELGADEYLIKSQAVIADVMKRIRFHLGLRESASPAGR
jgi:DNA-binding response OmpR family regulator